MKRDPKEVGPGIRHCQLHPPRLDLLLEDELHPRHLLPLADLQIELVDLARGELGVEEGEQFPLLTPSQPRPGEEEEGEQHQEEDQGEPPEGQWAERTGPE